MFKMLLTSFCWLCAFVCHAQSGGSGEILLPDAIRYIPTDTSSIADGLDAIVRDNSRIIISWKVTGNSGDFFVIERSSNNKEYETIAAIKQIRGAIKMEWMDDQPPKGKNLYRIRCNMVDGSVRYTGSISVNVGGNIAFRFYPNPADNVLIIRTEQAIDFAILDGNGKVRISQNQVTGLQLINVSTLEKGVYIIRIVNRQANTIFQDKLVKN